MAFRYDAPTPRFAATIAEMIRGAGDIRARAAEDIGQQQAQAVQQSGAAWAGGIRGVGQAVAAIPGMLQQSRQQQMDAEEHKARIDNMRAQEAQRAAAARRQELIEQQTKVIDDTMANALQVDPETGVATFKRDVFEQSLIKGGNGHRYPEYAELLDKLDARAATRAKEGRAMLADALVGVEKGGYKPEAVLTAVAYLKANKLATPEHIEPLLGVMADDPSPESIKGIVDRLGNALPEYRALKTAEETRAADLAKKTADTAKTEAETLKLDAEVAGTLPQTPAQKAAATQFERTQSEVERRNKETADLRRQELAQQAARTAASDDSKIWVNRNGKPVYVLKNDVQAGDAPFDRTRVEGRPVLSGDANKIIDIDTAIKESTALQSVLDNPGDTGLLSTIGAWMPNFVTEYTGGIGEGPKKRQATIALVRQVIGKGLEGGVLRKEDEIKYKDILPIISDTDEVVKGKIKGLGEMLERKRETTIETLGDAGFNVEAIKARGAPTAPAAPSGRQRVVGPNGQTGTVPAGTALPAGWKLQ